MSSKIVKGGRVVDPSVGLDELRDLLIEGETISAVDKPGGLDGVKDAEIIDAKGCYVVPGLIDIHVHLREPGQEWKETIATGCSSAVAGGFTAVCCMPNTSPVNDTAQTTEFVLRKAKEANSARVFPIGAISKGMKGEEISPMLEMFEAGCVAFSDDGKPVSNANLMRRALEYSRIVNGVLTCHEEVLSLTHDFAMNEGAYSAMLGLRGYPEAGENIMIARDIELARLTKGRVHFCHVTTARGAVLIRRAKEDGISVTAEVSPHHLTLTEKAVEGFDTNVKMSPPLRTEADVEALLEALETGVIDCIASDHAPHEHDSKNRDFPSASFGIVGLQTTVPLILAKVREGKLSLKRAIEALTSSPAQCFNMKPNQIRKGQMADITLISPDRKMVFSRETNRSKSMNSPFFGQELQGIAVATIVGGDLKYSLQQSNA